MKIPKIENSLDELYDVAKSHPYKETKFSTTARIFTPSKLLENPKDKKFIKSELKKLVA